MSIATPVLAWISTIQANTGLTNTANLTVTVNITSGWQIVVPVRVLTPNTTGISSGATISVYRSLDGGNNYDNIAIAPMGLPRPTAASMTQQASLKLETGQYAIQIQAGGNSVASTWTVSVLTCQVLTSILNQ